MKKLPTASIEDSYKNIVGKPSGGGYETGGERGIKQRELDNIFEYQGTKYGDLSSYKAGEGGGQSLDRLAQMMGGQIYNPYQYARMTSSGSASGEHPYKSEQAAEAARASAQSAAELQKMRGEQEMGLQYMRGEQEMNLSKFNKGLGYTPTSYRPIYPNKMQQMYSA